MRKNLTRVCKFLLLAFVLSMMPVCALTETVVTDMYQLCEALMPGEDGKISDSILFANDIQWQEVDYCYDDEETSDAVLVFRYDVVLDMGGHTFEVVVGTHNLIEVIGNANATIKNGQIMFGSKSEYDEEDETTYTTNGNVNGEYVKFTDKGGASRGTLTFDNVHMHLDVYPASNPLFESENIVLMNGEDTLNMIGGSDILFRDKGDSKYTSVLVNAQGSGNTLYMKNSHLTGSAIKDGIVGSCAFKNEGAYLSLFVKDYFIKSENMKLTMNGSEFTGYGGKGISLKDSSLTMSNGSVLWQDDGSIPLTIENKNVSIKLDDTSWMELHDEINVPAGTKLTDYLNTQDGIGFETNRITMVGKRCEVRFTDGSKNKELFADRVYSVIYMDSIPYKDWEGIEGLIGFTPDVDGRVIGDMTFTAIWEATDESDAIVIEVQETNGDVAAPIQLVSEVIEAALEKKQDIVIRQNQTEITLPYQFMKAVGIDGNETVTPPNPQSVPVEEICDEIQMKAVEGMKVVAAFSMEMRVGEELITDFNGYEQEFPIPFNPPAGMTVDQFELMHIDENGQTETMEITYHDGQSFAVFTHFSDYVVVQKDKAVELPQTGDNSRLLLWAGLLALSLCAAAAGRKARA